METFFAVWEESGGDREKTQKEKDAGCLDCECGAPSPVN